MNTRLIAIMNAIDNFLYRKLGIVTSSRKEKWYRDAVRIQAELDGQHKEPKWGHWIFD